jgi:hypothetical protein
MRLNAIWGMENKEKPCDILKAEVDVMQVAEGGVFYDVLPETQQKFESDGTDKTTDLEIMISLFMR